MNYDDLKGILIDVYVDNSAANNHTSKSGIENKSLSTIVPLGFLQSGLKFDLTNEDKHVVGLFYSGTDYPYFLTPNPEINGAWTNGLDECSKLTEAFMFFSSNRSFIEFINQHKHIVKKSVYKIWTYDVELNDDKVIFKGGVKSVVNFD